MAGEDTVVTGVPGRYATALFELAQNDKALDKVEGDLAAFRDMLDGSDDLKRLVRSPVFGVDAQSKALSAVLDKAGIGGLTKNFLLLVVKNRRLFAVSDMIRAYRTLMAGHRGEVTADVVSATELTAAQEKSLQAALKSVVGKDVQVEKRVDATLLGGLIVKIGSRMFDNSLRTKLDNLKIAMKEVG